jgi:Sap, sulfolipid-1-addressing protein
MGEAIGQILTLGVGVALSPVPIIALVLMLGTPRARRNGPAFLLGWLVGLVLVGTVVLLISSGADANTKGAPATWVGVLKLVLGALLLAFAAHTWRSRPTGEDRGAGLPAWMSAVDSFTAPRSLGMGVALAAVNPKNLTLTVAGAAAIAQTGVGGGEQALALAIFVVLGTLGPGAPLAIYFVLGDRAPKLLDALKGWLATNNATIMAILCLLIATKLIGDGITTLSG